MSDQLDMQRYIQLAFLLLLKLRRFTSKDVMEKIGKLIGTASPANVTVPYAESTLRDFMIAQAFTGAMLEGSGQISEATFKKHLLYFLKEVFGGFRPPVISEELYGWVWQELKYRDSFLRYVKSNFVAMSNNVDLILPLTKEIAQFDAKVGGKLTPENIDRYCWAIIKMAVPGNMTLVSKLFDFYRHHAIIATTSRVLVHTHGGMEQVMRFLDTTKMVWEPEPKLKREIRTIAANFFLLRLSLA